MSDEPAERAEWEKEREERRYRDRRERFALTVFRTLILQGVDPSKLADYRMLAKQAVEAADALDDELYPDDVPILPDYVA